MRAHFCMREKSQISGVRRSRLESRGRGLICFIGRGISQSQGTNKAPKLRALIAYLRYNFDQKPTNKD